MPRFLMLSRYALAGMNTSVTVPGFSTIYSEIMRVRIG